MTADGRHLGQLRLAGLLGVAFVAGVGLGVVAIRPWPHDDELKQVPEQPAKDFSIIEQEIRATCVELHYAETPDAPRCDEMVKTYRQVNGIVDSSSDQKEEEDRAPKEKTSRRKGPLDD